MKPFIVGICGGSGSGKSTLAFGLQDAFPGKVTIFHIDDYFRPEDKIPVLHDMANWDDPAAIYSRKMVRDLQKLKSGKSAIINTKSPRLNPDFLKTGQRIPVKFYPKPLIVVEGFLALHFKALRDLFDYSIYLEIPFEQHASRRVHGKLHKFPPEYNEYVLKPMHDRYVVQNKKYADLVIDVATLSKEAVLQTVENALAQRAKLL